MKNDLRFTPELITSDMLEENDVFVFGSNVQGIHGRGAALLARELGAIDGLSHGFTDLEYRTYGIRTKDLANPSVPPMDMLSLDIGVFVNMLYSGKYSNKTFWLTKIGTGLAKIEPWVILDILERNILSHTTLRFIPENLKMPKEWYESLSRDFE